MKRIGSRAFILGVVMTLLSGGCTSEDSRAWRTAQEEGSAAGFMQFVERFPDSPHAGEARREAARLSYLAIGPGGSVADYEAFLAKFPESEPAAEAHAAVRRLKFPLEPQGFPHLQATHREATACAGAGSAVTTFEAVEDTPISAEQLRTVFGWDGGEIVWKWSDRMSGIELTNGSVYALGPGTVDRRRGVPFEMGFRGEGFGDLCVGNLQVEGPLAFTSAGVRLHKGTRISHVVAAGSATAR